MHDDWLSARSGWRKLVNQNDHGHCSDWHRCHMVSLHSDQRVEEYPTDSSPVGDCDAWHSGNHRKSRQLHLCRREVMDLPKAPTHDDVSTASGMWNWILFFISLLISGGLLEYLVSKRYVTRKEWLDQQQQCTQHLKDQFEIALLKNNARLEQRMVEAVSRTVKDCLKENNDTI